MLSEVNIDGVFVAPISAYTVAVIPVFLICRRALGHLRILRNTWHPALFELALYVTLLSVLMLAV